MPTLSPDGLYQSIVLSSFCFVKKIAIFLCPFSWPLMMASPPPPGAKRAGVRGRGWRWVLGSGGRGVSSSFRPHHLLDAPEEAHGKDHGK